MSFYRKVFVLKQIETGFSVEGKSLSGIATLEVESGVATLFLSLINFKSTVGGEYYFALLDGDGNFCTYPLAKRPTSYQRSFCAPINANGNVQGCVYFVEKDLPLLVAFGSSEGGVASQTLIRKKIAEKCLIEKKEKERAFEEIESVSFLDGEYAQGGNYNDEAVASENYFELEEEICEKIKSLSEIENEELSNEVELPFVSGEEKAKEEMSTPNCAKDETATTAFKKYSKANPYYDQARGELNEIFLKFEEEKELCKIFPESKWSKINYSKDKYYVVGVINEKGMPKYICYGVPASYSEKAPPELDGFCSFLPLSLFDVKGRGYWMMYQDAITGLKIDKYKP